MQLQNPKLNGTIFHENRIGKQVLVVLTSTELAEHVQLSEIQLEIQVPVARKLGGSLRLARSNR